MKRFLLFFQRRIVVPLLGQLKQGSTPERLSWALAWGATFSLFPILGVTTFICIFVAWIFKLNQVAMQVANHSVGLLQLLAIPVWLRLGEGAFGLPAVTFNPLRAGEELAASPKLFFAKYGASALAGIVVWTVAAPFLALFIRSIARPLLVLMQKKKVKKAPLNALRIRTLDLERQSPTSGERKFLAAASGLVRIDQTFYVIADDELGLGMFVRNAEVPGKFIKIRSGTLPDTSAERKKLKPDFEALVEIPGDPAEVRLLAIPSGSRANRTKGAFIRLRNGIHQATLEIDFSPLFTELTRQIPELNIEGAVLEERSLFLFQRGNGSAGKNAFIEIQADRFLHHLEEKTVISASLIRGITQVELGDLEGTPLSFTDAALAPDGNFYFLGAAETGKSTYEDGICKGSIVGMLERSGKVLWSHEITPLVKAEGIAVDENRIYIVTDADNSEEPAALYEIKMPPTPLS